MVGGRGGADNCGPGLEAGGGAAWMVVSAGGVPAVSAGWTGGGAADGWVSGWLDPFGPAAEPCGVEGPVWEKRSRFLHKQQPGCRTE